jgi:hypothetical protein
VLTCVQVNYAKPLDAPAPSSGKLVFVSKATFTPGTGLASADTLCDNEKAGAKALLATSTRSASSLLSGSYVRADGVPIDLGNMMTASRSGIWVHADGSYVQPVETSAVLVWNGSQNFNSMPVQMAHTCGNWASTNGIGDVGFTVAGTPAWGIVKQSCATALPLYCYEP